MCFFRFVFKFATPRWPSNVKKSQQAKRGHKETFQVAGGIYVSCDDFRLWHADTKEKLRMHENSFDEQRCVKN